MIRLLIAPAGGGKTWWLMHQAPHDAPLLDLTLTTHRQALVALADAVGVEIPRRATIADLVALLATCQAKARLDNIDRAGRKVLYSVMALAEAGWEIWATATDRRRVRVLLERQAAVLVPYRSPDLADVIKTAWPEATAADIARIRSLAKTPAAAANLARLAAAGEPLNVPPPARSLYPMLSIGVIIALALWKQAHAEALDYATLTAVTLLMYWLRRRFYLRG